MILERCLFLSCVAALSLAAAGCADGASNSQDPPIEAVDSPQGAAPSKHAPDEYWVKLETTKGDVVIEVKRSWSPYGADRFYALVEDGFFNDCRLFRVVEGFVVQTGIAAKPDVNAKWTKKNIPDDTFVRGDKNRHSNKRGYVTFAKSAMPNSRTTQFYINCGDNSNLDAMGFTPFGKVLDGMAAVDSFYGGYAEEPLKSTPRIEAEGNAYLDQAFPKLDSIKKATLLPKKPDLSKQPAG
jgi:peptidyl-prolyl cis-trans isomerase A (cyclophilin A)